MQLVTLNGKQLREIAHKSRTAEITITSLALRERLRHFSDISRTRNQLVRAGEKIVEDDYRQLWKDLQAAGVGSIIYGRKGKPDRFEWHFSLKKIAKAALEGTNQEAERVPSENELASPAKEVKTIRRPAPNLQVVPSPKHVYIALRNDFDVEIKLPHNISAQEIETIKKALDRTSA